MMHCTSVRNDDFGCVCMFLTLIVFQIIRNWNKKMCLSLLLLLLLIIIV